MENTIKIKSLLFSFCFLFCLFFSQFSYTKGINFLWRQSLAKKIVLPREKLRKKMDDIKFGRFRYLIFDESNFYLKIGEEGRHLLSDIIIMTEIFLKKTNKTEIEIRKLKDISDIALKPRIIFYEMTLESFKKDLNNMAFLLEDLFVLVN